MLSRLLLLIFGLIALSYTIEAKVQFKRLHEKELKELKSSSVTHSGGKALNSISRKRRNANESSDGETISLFLLYRKMIYTLSEYIEEITGSNTNVTLIGWQRVYDNEGNVEAINTVQLVIPPKPIDNKANNVVENGDHDDNGRLIISHSYLNELKEVCEPIAEIGIPCSRTVENFNKEGKNDLLVYMDTDQRYVKIGDLVTYNKTAIADSEKVENFIKDIKPTILGNPAVLRYDADGNLITESSKVTPHLLGSVINHYEAPDEVLQNSPDIIAKISQQYSKEEIPKQLARYYNTAFPKYKWRVLVDPSHYYITRDVSVTLKYDNFNLDENSDIFYLVYGIKKSEDR